MTRNLGLPDYLEVTNPSWLNPLSQRCCNNGRTGGPTAPPYTFIDYEVDPAGVAETLTWAQLQSRAHVVAEELRVCGSSGGRAAILAPQGLDYIVAFFGAVQAGFVAVPLPVPQFGALDARTSSALRDCRPSAVLTTSSAAGRVAPYAQGWDGKPAPAVIEVDLLEEGSAALLDPIRPVLSETAYLQYSSGSTRQPAGVVITHRNVIANVEQCASDYIGNEVPPEAVFVSWLPFYHDMGWVVGVCAPLVLDRTAVLMSPSSFLRRPARWMQLLAAITNLSPARPLSLWNWLHEEHLTMTWPDFTSVTFSELPAVANGSTPPRSAASRSALPASVSTSR